MQCQHRVVGNPIADKPIKVYEGVNIGLGTSRCYNVSSEIETIALSTRLEVATLYFIVGTYLL